MSFSAQEVLITEHLTFAPLSLVDDIINTANALLYKSVNAMEQLFSNLPSEVIPDEEVESGIHKFETLLESAVDRNFDAMELFVLRNITSIPEDLIDWVQLKHHQGLDFTTDDSAEVDEELTKARKTLAATQKVKAMIDRESQVNARRLASLDAHAEKLKFLQDKAAEKGVAVRESAEHIKEQVKALQEQLDRTIDISTNLQASKETNERSRYIEEVVQSKVRDTVYEDPISKVGTVEDMQAAAERLKR